MKKTDKISKKNITPPAFPPEEKLNRYANKRSLILILGIIILIVVLISVAVLLMLTTA